MSQQGPGLLQRLWKDAPAIPGGKPSPRHVLLLLLNARPADATELLRAILDATGGVFDAEKHGTLGRGYSVAVSTLMGGAEGAELEVHSVSSPRELEVALPEICARFATGEFSFITAIGLVRLSELQGSVAALVSLLRVLRGGPLPQCQEARTVNSQLCTAFAKAASRKISDVLVPAPDASPLGFPLSIWLRYSTAAIARRRSSLGGSLASALLGLRVVAAHFGASLFSSAEDALADAGARVPLRASAGVQRAVSILDLSEAVGPGFALIAGTLLQHLGLVGTNELVNSLAEKICLYQDSDSMLLSVRGSDTLPAMPAIPAVNLGLLGMQPFLALRAQMTSH